MAEQISNKTLLVLLVVAIGVSVMGIWVSLSKQTTVLTGASIAQTGTLSVSVGEYVAIAINNNSISFDNITLSGGISYCLLESNSTSDQLDLIGNATGLVNFTVGSDGILGNASVSGKSPIINFTCLTNTSSCLCNSTTAFNTSAFVLQNDGNVYSAVVMNFSASRTFFGDSRNSNISYKGVVREGGRSCPSSFANGTWYNLTTSNSQVCGCMNYTDATDSISVPIALHLVSDSQVGVRNGTVEFLVTNNNSCGTGA